MGAHKAHQTDAPNAFANKREKVHSAQSVCLPARQCWWEAYVGRGRGAHNCEKRGLLCWHPQPQLVNKRCNRAQQ